MPSVLLDIDNDGRITAIYITADTELQQQGMERSLRSLGILSEHEEDYA